MGQGCAFVHGFTVIFCAYVYHVDVADLLVLAVHLSWLWLWCCVVWYIGDIRAVQVMGMLGHGNM